MSTTGRGIVLFAHGSRDPLWSRPMERIAQRMRERAPAVRVRCAYLELMQPDLAAAVGQLAAEGVQHITVVPLFLGMGKHAREDLPRQLEALAQAHPRIGFRTQPAVGEDARMVELLAELALS